MTLHSKFTHYFIEVHAHWYLKLLHFGIRFVLKEETEFDIVKTSFSTRTKSVMEYNIKIDSYGVNGVFRGNQLMFFFSPRWVEKGFYNSTTFHFIKLEQIWQLRYIKLKEATFFSEACLSKSAKSYWVFITVNLQN